MVARSSRTFKFGDEAELNARYSMLIKVWEN